MPWRVVFPDSEHAAASGFLRDVAASDCSVATLRNYGYDLLRWFRFLHDRWTAWERAERADVREFVELLRESPVPQRLNRQPEAPPPGSVNPVTGKPRSQCCSRQASGPSRPRVRPVAPPNSCQRRAGRGRGGRLGTAPVQQTLHVVVGGRVVHQRALPAARHEGGQEQLGQVLTHCRRCRTGCRASRGWRAWPSSPTGHVRSPHLPCRLAAGGRVRLTDPPLPTGSLPGRQFKSRTSACLVKQARRGLAVRAEPA